MVPFARTFPTPGGGLDRNRIPEWREKYGNDIVFLMGASLYKHPDGVKAASQEVRTVLDSMV
jgi:ribulose-bisphosphate carboxylase large chain